MFGLMLRLYFPAAVGMFAGQREDYRGGFVGRRTLRPSELQSEMGQP